MILHYKLVKLWGQQADIEAAELDVIYNQLHRKYAPRTLALILKLRGFYVKIGQVGCSCYPALSLTAHPSPLTARPSPPHVARWCPSWTSSLSSIGRN